MKASWCKLHEYHECILQLMDILGKSCGKHAFHTQPEASFLLQGMHNYRSCEEGMLGYWVVLL